MLKYSTRRNQDVLFLQNYAKEKESIIRMIFTDLKNEIGNNLSAGFEYYMIEALYDVDEGERAYIDVRYQHFLNFWKLTFYKESFFKIFFSRGVMISYSINRKYDHNFRSFTHNEGQSQLYYLISPDDQRFPVHGVNVDLNPQFSVEELKRSIIKAFSNQGGMTSSEDLQAYRLFASGEELFINIQTYGCGIYSASKNRKVNPIETKTEKL